MQPSKLMTWCWEKIGPTPLLVLRASSTLTSKLVTWCWQRIGPTPSLLSQALTTMIYYWLLTIYGPLYILALCMLQVKLVINKAKRSTGIGMIYHGNMSPLSRKSKVSDIGRISTEEEIDFLTHRSLPYIVRMVLWTAKETARFLLRQQTVEMISDSQLVYVLFYTVFAHELRWNDSRQMYDLDLSDIKRFTLFQGFFWEAMRVSIDPQTTKIEIEMEDGTVLCSKSSSKDKPNYELAKLHLQVCLTYYAPGLEHNYVHFVFPSALCVSTKRLLRKDSTLYKLLAPHFRFTERLNYQALRICHASSNKRSLTDRLLCPWKPFPITKEQFSSQMEEKLIDYYVNVGGKNCFVRPEGSEHESSDVEEKNDLTGRDHWLFPPPYVTDKQMQKIPYLNFLAQYYDVIKEFVKSLEPHVEREEWQQISQTIAQDVPRFEYVSFVDAVTTFIHMVSVVHSSDHTSYCHYFARQYGCMCIRSPFELFSNKEAWKEEERTLGIPIDVIKRSPALLINSLDVMRTRCFLNVFVDFIPSPTCDLSLIGADYDFSSRALRREVAHFKTSLRSLDGNLKYQPSPINIERGKNDERRGIGMQLVKLEDFVSSNCY